MGGDVLRFDRTTEDRIRNAAVHDFLRRLEDQMLSDAPGFADQPVAARRQFIDDSIAWSNSLGFVTERGLVFLCNLAWRLPQGWTDIPAVAEVLGDRGPSEAERLYRLKRAVEQAKWTG
jgi:hypothetical protein